MDTYTYTNASCPICRELFNGEDDDHKREHRGCSERRRYALLQAAAKIYSSGREATVIGHTPEAGYPVRQARDQWSAEIAEALLAEIEKREQS